MKVFRLIALLGLAVPTLLAAGCEKQSVTPQDIVQELRSLSGPPKELDWVDDPDPDKRREAIVALSAKPQCRKPPFTTFYVLELASDKDALVRAAAARALGVVGDPNYLPPLVRALDDPSPVVRGDVAWALDRVTGEAAVRPLCLQAVDDESLDVRAACFRALGHYPLAKVGKTLIRGLSDADLSVRDQAHATLVALAGEDVGDRPEAWSVYLDRYAKTAGATSKP
ncbi:MAG: HEAT repeat domain-containing protein [Phycisphaerae bacterium]|jgi:HEAT repeat protein